MTLSLQREQTFFRDNGICQLRNLGLTDHRCAGPPQCAHVPSKQAIKLRRKAIGVRLRIGGAVTEAERHLFDTPEAEVVSDVRGALTICERGHNAWDLLGQRSTRDSLPAHVLEFCEEYALESCLDRLFCPVGAAA